MTCMPPTARAVCTAARNVHVPAVVAQTPSPVFASGWSSVLLTTKVSAKVGFGDSHSTAASATDSVNCLPTVVLRYRRRTPCFADRVAQEVPSDGRAASAGPDPSSKWSTSETWQDQYRRSRLRRTAHWAGFRSGRQLTRLVGSHWQVPAGGNFRGHDERVPVGRFSSGPGELRSSRDTVHPVETPGRHPPSKR